MRCCLLTGRETSRHLRAGRQLGFTGRVDSSHLQAGCRGLLAGSFLEGRQPRPTLPTITTSTDPLGLLQAERNPKDTALRLRPESCVGSRNISVAAEEQGKGVWVFCRPHAPSQPLLQKPKHLRIKGLGTVGHACNG